MEENKIPASDEIIRQKIAELLFNDPTIDSGRIQVEVTNGEALLKGHIDTEVEKQRSEELARSVEGVKKVVNHLHIDVGLAHALSNIAAHIQGDIIKGDDDDTSKI
ncbi:BON domain-containing protein [Terrimonas pollutisoli]|uniref:BON domain-containing protein n=1 Tax=Terrimonas pollutisoli TaxID=3034147 RepID=UPI0023EE0835|nr:BON domain-containing protein [Terrimonas sp. H1YJ31]